MVSIPDAKSLSRVAEELDQVPPDVRGALLREALAKKVLDDAEVLVDDGVLDARVDLMIDRHKMQLEEGTTFEEQLASSCTSEAEIRLELRTLAAEAIRKEAVVHHLAETNGIAVTAEDMDEAIGALGGMLKLTTDEAREKLAREGRLPAFFQTILFEKVTDFLVEEALGAES